MEERLAGWHWGYDGDDWIQMYWNARKSFWTFDGGEVFEPQEVGPRIPSPEELLAQSAELARLKANIKVLDLTVDSYDKTVLDLRSRLAASEERVRGLMEALDTADAAFATGEIDLAEHGPEDFEADCPICHFVKLRAALLAPAPTSGEKPE